MAGATAGRSGRIGAFRIAAAVASLAALVAAWRLGLRWPIAPAVLLMILALWVVPRLVRGRQARFEREAMRLLAAGDAAAVPPLARRQLLLQLFGDAGPVDALLGVAHARLEAWPQALAHLDAAARCPGVDAAAVGPSLVKALVATGDLARAEREGRAVIEGGPELAETLALVARARVGIGRAGDGVAALLERAEALSPSADAATMIALVRIEAQLATGRRPDDLPGGADSRQRLVRAWIHYVRGLLRLHRGEPDGAAASFAKAEREAGEAVPLFAALAHERLGRLAARR